MFVVEEDTVGKSNKRRNIRVREDPEEDVTFSEEDDDEEEDADGVAVNDC